MIKTKLVSTRLLLSVGFLLSVQHAYAVKLSIDNSSSIVLSEDIHYDIPSQVVEFTSSEPVICRNFSSPSNGLNAEIIDPNNQLSKQGLYNVKQPKPV